MPATARRVERSRLANLYVAVAVAGHNELTRFTNRSEHMDVHLRAVAATDMVNDLVYVIGECILRMRTLVQFGQYVTRDLENAAPATIEAQATVGFPLDLVTELVFVTRVCRIENLELLVGVAENQRSNVFIQIGAARIAAVLVTKGTAGLRIDGRMPGRITETIRTNDRITVVNLDGALTRKRRP